MGVHVRLDVPVGLGVIVKVRVCLAESVETGAGVRVTVGVKAGASVPPRIRSDIGGLLSFGNCR